MLSTIKITSELTLWYGLLCHWEGPQSLYSRQVFYLDGYLEILQSCAVENTSTVMPLLRNSWQSVLYIPDVLCSTQRLLGMSCQFSPYVTPSKFNLLNL